MYMKKILIVLLGIALCPLVSAAGSTADFTGEYHGLINVANEYFKEGVVNISPTDNDSMYRFVLPDFCYETLCLGDISVPEVVVKDSALRVTDYQMWLDVLQINVGVTICDDMANNIRSAFVGKDSISVYLMIDVPGLTVIPVYFNGSRHVADSTCAEMQTVRMDTTVCDTLLPCVWRGHCFVADSVVRDTLSGQQGCDSIEYVYSLHTTVCKPVIPDTVPDPAGKEFKGEYSGTLVWNSVSVPNVVVDVFPAADKGKYIFAVPALQYGGITLGDVVVADVGVDRSGALYLTQYPLYLPAPVDKHVVLHVVNDPQTKEPSAFAGDELTVCLIVEVPGKENVQIRLTCKKTSGGYYQPRNKGMEGEWDKVSIQSGSTVINGIEPGHWNSFITGTGKYIAAAANNKQLVEGTPRPGSGGSKSAVITSNLTLGVKANGNLTNGRLNGASMKAEDATANYNYTDVTDDNFNQPFAGRPDSMTVWVKYVPADGDITNPDNTANMSAVIHTDGFWKEPSDAACKAVKIGDARQDIYGTANNGWQRLSIPFAYADTEETGKYILITFTTCATPGGGTTYKDASTKEVHYDSLYVDDINMVYNAGLDKVEVAGNPVIMDGTVGTIDSDWCDSCYRVVPYTNGVGTHAYVGYNPNNKTIVVVVKGNDFAADTHNYKRYLIGTSGVMPVNTDDDADGIFEVAEDRQSVRKILIGDRLYLHANGVRYDVTGRRCR